MHAANPKDPLLRSTAAHQRECFNRMSVAATGFQVEDAIGAAFNVIVNAMRQAHATRQAAETRFDELYGQMKARLLDNYDANGKRRQGVFPFNQTVHVDLHVDRDKFHKQ